MVRGVLANEIQHLDGVVYLCEHTTKIKIMDVHKKHSCTALKNKQNCVDRCKELDLNTQGYLTTLKDQLMCVCHFEKKVTKFKTKVFQRDFVNIFGESNFTSICFVNKDLMCATGNNEI